MQSYKEQGPKTEFILINIVIHLMTLYLQKQFAKNNRVGTSGIVAIEADHDTAVCQG